MVQKTFHHSCSTFSSVSDLKKLNDRLRIEPTTLKTQTCCLTHWATQSDDRCVFMRFSVSSCVSDSQNFSESRDRTHNLKTSSQLSITVSYSFTLNFSFCRLFNLQSCGSISKIHWQTQIWTHNPKNSTLNWGISTHGANRPGQSTLKILASINLQAALAWTVKPLSSII